jgi:hypothetical protein
MSLISLIVVIVVVGVLLWAVESFLPMSPPIKRLLQIVVVLVLILWLLQVFGLLGGADIRIGR